MIKPQTILNIADNCGAKTIMCIQVLGTSNKKEAYLGDFIIGAVKKATPNMGVKKSDVVKAVIVRQTKPFVRKDGSVIRFSDNAAIILNKENNPKGTRVFGPIAKEIRLKNLTKLISLSKILI